MVFFGNKVIWLLVHSIFGKKKYGPLLRQKALDKNSFFSTGDAMGSGLVVLKPTKENSFSFNLSWVVMFIFYTTLSTKGEDRHQTFSKYIALLIWYDITITFNSHNTYFNKLFKVSLLELHGSNFKLTGGSSFWIRLIFAMVGRTGSASHHGPVPASW